MSRITCKIAMAMGKIVISRKMFIVLISMVVLAECTDKPAIVGG